MKVNGVDGGVIRVRISQISIIIETTPSLSIATNGAQIKEILAQAL